MTANRGWIFVALAVAPWTSKSCPGIAPLFATVVTVPPRLTAPVEEVELTDGVFPGLAAQPARSADAPSDATPAEASRRRLLRLCNPPWGYWDPRVCFGISPSLGTNDGLNDLELRHQAEGFTCLIQAVAA